ncbi:4-hydroxy-3-methylbut-2-enyl diphosphate reductase [Brackiella oedipodis]|uniref:4-hydroxy-3-methylbut-2-enyl diphosphate reductase n=1 Tax=Brackiella oedipodis TaxID=124225 RepID=UPI00048D3B41|nr:4-hydroxy-3-methylbut-2-enyl diphosphate reductase [Brackiella oedipodis]
MTQDNRSEILLAEPRGFCAGVDRAIDIVERALELHGAPIYVRHEIVHNRFVVQSLRDKGAIFIDELDQAPKGSIVVFSAHGVPLSVRQEAEQRGLQVFDATCPLVTKVHMEVKKMHNAGKEIIMIGHRGHPEVEGTLGQAKGRMHLVETPEDVAQLVVDDPENLAYVTQTTLSVDDASLVTSALKKRFPNIAEPKKSDICYATQNRQDAVKKIASQCDVFFVVGSVNSSNSNRLREVAERLGCPSYLIDGPDSIKPEWLHDKQNIGITAGASAPEVLVQDVIIRLKELGAIAVRKMDGIEENVSFPLPKALSRKIAPSST